MRKSLHELRLMEDYLLGHMSTEQQQQFQLKLLLDPHFGEDVALQKEAYAQIKHYGREKLREELRAVEEKLFHGPHKKSFRQRILSLFT